MSNKTRLYYASDIHGSEICFKKFINAAKFYEADTLLLGGDITGKSIAFIADDGNGNYSCSFMGKIHELHSGSELGKFTKLLRGFGHIPYTAKRDEIADYYESEEKMNNLFSQLTCGLVQQWLELAEERLKGTGIRCLIMIGNDDIPEIAELLSQSDFVENPEEKVIDLDDFHQLISIGWSNPTPWNTPHECSEDELEKKIDGLVQKVKAQSLTILCSHAPPYGSGLDDAPKLKDNLEYETVMGQVQLVPAGSTAVRDAILKYGFIAGLHGHIHEARAIKRLGRTLCINPGSDYGDGTLHGALLTFKKEKLIGYQLVSG
jgi:Icc-related predicted phosphoesterase